MNINTTLEAVAIEYLLPDKITICNIYIPNSQSIGLNELKNLEAQLTKPFIIVGDFNSHNVIWGSTSTDSRGKIVEKFLEDPGLNLLNLNLPTHFNSGNGTESIIDLSIASATITEKLDWQVLDDLHDSDHYPILIQVNTNSEATNQNNNNILKNWNFKKANWELYRTELKNKTTSLEEPTIDKKQNINQLCEDFNQLLFNTANLAIPRFKTKEKKDKSHGGTKNAPRHAQTQNMLLINTRGTEPSKTR